MGSSACNLRVSVKSRREFLQKSSFGFGALALEQLLDQRVFASGNSTDLANPLAPKLSHFTAKAKQVIFIFLQGGPSQVDTFDPKPVLNRLDGHFLPESFLQGETTLAQIKANESKLMGTRRVFKRYGQSGLEISDLFQNLAKQADDLAVVRSCYHDTVIHGPAISLIHAGSIRLGSPSMGAWVLYGLGCETDNLPAYVVMADGFLRNSKGVIGSGFLPAVYQATVVSTEGVPLENLSRPLEVEGESQRAILDQ